MDYQQRVTGWLEPIAGEGPAGSDARYDTVHESIRNQIASLDAPTGPDVVWPEIVKQSEALITSQSKDVLIACYAAYGLFQSDGLAGLASGLWMVAELTERYWENGFPPLKRIRARVNAFDWLTDRLELVLPEMPIDGSDREAVEALREAVDRLSDVSSARFEDKAPKMRPLLECVKRFELSLPPPSEGEKADEPEPAPPPPEAPPVEPPPVPQEAAPSAPAAQDAPPEEQAGAESDDATKPPEGEDLVARLETLAKPYLEPIPGDAPVGLDARYDPDHEAVRTAISQLDTPTGGEVDWGAIEQQCKKLLTEKTKDILIAAYAAGAMFEKSGLIGLAEGIAVLTGVINTFWEDGFPPLKRIRARSNALDWLISRLEVLSEQPITASDKEAVLLLQAGAKKFADVVYERFEDNAPAVRPLLTNVDRLVMSLPAPAPEKPAPAPKQPSAAPPPKAPETAPSPKSTAPPQANKSVELPKAQAEFSGVKELGGFLKKVGASLYSAAREVFKAEPANPNSYRLSRLGLLLHFEKPPTPTSGKQTGVPAPPQNVISQIEVLAENQNWEMLLEEAEGALGRNRLWLDLHRYVAMALGGLGYDAARAAMLTATSDVLKRLPELRDLQFNTGLPFASGPTQQWIDDEVITKGCSEGEGDGLSDEARQALAEARGLAGAGKVAEAVELLGEVSGSGTSASVRFRARLATAQACVVGGSLTAADGIFSALYKEIDEYNLEQWDPDLVTGCYVEHYEVLKSMAKKASEGITRDPSLTERLSGVYARLCRVSPSTALKLGG